MEQVESPTCAECGARLFAGMSCKDMLGWVIGWESEDEELSKEHFKTVACYNLEHPSLFTDEALCQLRVAFMGHMDEGMAVSEIRRRMGAMFEGDMKVMKDPSSRKATPRDWRMTIADVFCQGNPQGAADRVRTWAKNLRSEL